MTRLPLIGLLLVVCMCAPACGDDDSPTSPTPAPLRFTAQLSPANEVPAITNADASGSGSMTLTLNVTRDAAQAITAATGDFQVSLTGFPASTTLTGAHIHPGRAGTNGGVIVNLAVGAGEFVLANGAVTFTKSGINVPADVASQLLNDPAAFYFNVHTTLNTGGAVRGQVARQQ